MLVEVSIGTATLSTTPSAWGAWLVNVPADADYIAEPSVPISVTATKTGYTSATPVTGVLRVDVTAPTVSYTPPDRLQVGEWIGLPPMGTSDTDIYSYSGSSLPPGLIVNETTGAIGGAPTTANASAQTATVTVADSAGNVSTETIAFPAVVKGDQTFTFSYGAPEITYG